jgi:hypothetical protein
MAGPLFENAVFAELYRYFVHRGEIPRVNFWRAASGHEVDFLVEWEGKVFGVEAKATATPRPDDGKTLTLVGDLMGDLFAGGILACLSGGALHLREDIRAIHLWDLC